MKKIINHYAQYVKECYGERIQKISIDAGFTCPNRDGKNGLGGCTFCNNDSFSTGLRGVDISKQITDSISYFKKKNPKLKKFIVYFQSYTNTYASLADLKEIYNQALSIEGVIGLSIGTRPDCLEQEKIDFFHELGKNYDITLEIGVESCHNSTLNLINRGHDFHCFTETLARCRNKNFKVGTHIILGFPNESRQMMIQSFKLLGQLPIHFLKVHQLLIIKKTILSAQYLSSPFPLLSQDDYIEILAEGLTFIPQDMVIQRVFSTASDDLLVSPKWTATVNTTPQKLEKYMSENNFYQGMNCL